MVAGLVQHGEHRHHTQAHFEPTEQSGDQYGANRAVQSFGTFGHHLVETLLEFLLDGPVVAAQFATDILWVSLVRVDLIPFSGSRRRWKLTMLAWPVENRGLKMSFLETDSAARTRSASESPFPLFQQCRPTDTLGKRTASGSSISARAAAANSAPVRLSPNHPTHCCNRYVRYARLWTRFTPLNNSPPT